MEAKKYLLKTFDIAAPGDINDLPAIPASVVVELMEDFKVDKLKKRSARDFFTDDKSPTKCWGCGSSDISIIENDNVCGQCGRTWALIK